MKAALQRTAWVTNLQQQQFWARSGDRSKDAKPKLAEKSLLLLSLLSATFC